jgi:phosphatidate cytidylyltransferase
MNKFVTRTISGAVYVLIVVGSIYSGKLLGGDSNTYQQIIGNFVFSAVLFVIGIIGIHEVIANLRKKEVVVNAPLGYAVGVLTYLILALWLNGDNLFYTANLTMLPALLPMLWLAVFLVQLWREDQRPFDTVGHTLLPSLWVMTPLALMTHIQNQSAGLMMMVFILIWVNDSFAYMTGMLLGRHKMWERHSPNKTWEGTLGGIIFCIAAAMLVGPLFDTRALNFDRSDWAVVALVCSIIGTLGDLVESMFKRYCGVKDSGKIMPGHGGVLDRFDSLLLSTPFIIAYIVICEL